MRPSREKKWRPFGDHAGIAAAPNDLSESVTVAGPRDAETDHAGSAAGRCATAERILGPHSGSGRGSSGPTGSASESLALPGTHSSWHISQSAPTRSSTLAPGFRSAGG